MKKNANLGETYICNLAGAVQSCMGSLGWNLQDQCSGKSMSKLRKLKKTLAPLNLGHELIWSNTWVIPSRWWNMI